MVGLAMLVIGIAVHVIDNCCNVSDQIWRALYEQRIRSWSLDWDMVAARIGALLAIISYVPAYHYNRTIGRVVAWVCAGR